ncbi:MAG: four helix bundle protein [Anaerolineales bacterium]|nr:four helix bundle protein [Anaerolineales bacterium]
MVDDKPKSFEEWQESVPQKIRSGPLWSFGSYPRTSFLYELAWHDCERMVKDVRGRAIVEQLIRSAGSICANIEEGYGRGFGRDYAHFLGYALGSARETQGWYFRSKHLLPSDVLEHRLALIDEIIALLVKAIGYQRKIKR